MSDAEEGIGSGPPCEPVALRLRPERPRVTRLSRKVLMGGAVIMMLAISGSVMWSLRTKHGSAPAHEELFSTDHRMTADGLAVLPHDYAFVPRQVPPLGPPLPGDLGRPLLNAGMANNSSVSSPMDSGPEAQRRTQEIEAARFSRLFATTNTVSASAVPSAASRTPSIEPAALGAAAQTAQAALVSQTVSGSQPSQPSQGSQGSQGAQALADAVVAQNGQDHKAAFVNGSVDRRTESPDRLTSPTSPYVVQAGTVIPAALITGILSDLPGQITAQVTEAVYDTPTGQSLLIPQGSRLIGQYDSQVAFGQSRVLLVWTRLILPNGKSITLERQPGADAAGNGGLEDGVDNHWGSLFKAALLSTLLSVGSEAGTSGDQNNLSDAIRRGASQSFNQTGQQIVGRNLNIQPTLTIRPGFPVRVIVNRDLVLEPYQR